MLLRGKPQRQEIASSDEASLLELMDPAALEARLVEARARRAAAIARRTAAAPGGHRGPSERADAEQSLRRPVIPRDIVGAGNSPAPPAGAEPRPEDPHVSPISDPSPVSRGRTLPALPGRLQRQRRGGVRCRGRGAFGDPRRGPYRLRRGVDAVPGIVFGIVGAFVTPLVAPPAPWQWAAVRLDSLDDRAASEPTAPSPAPAVATRSVAPARRTGVLRVAAARRLGEARVPHRRPADGGSRRRDRVNCASDIHDREPVPPAGTQSPGASGRTRPSPRSLRRPRCSPCDAVAGYRRHSRCARAGSVPAPQSVALPGLSLPASPAMEPPVFAMPGDAPAIATAAADPGRSPQRIAAAVPASPFLADEREAAVASRLQPTLPVRHGRRHSDCRRGTSGIGSGERLHRAGRYVDRGGRAVASMPAPPASVTHAMSLPPAATRIAGPPAIRSVTGPTTVALPPDADAGDRCHGADRVRDTRRRAGDRHHRCVSQPFAASRPPAVTRLAPRQTSANPLSPFAPNRRRLRCRRSRRRPHWLQPRRRRCWQPRCEARSASRDLVPKPAVASMPALRRLGCRCRRCRRSPPLAASVRRCGPIGGGASTPVAANEPYLGAACVRDARDAPAIAADAAYPGRLPQRRPRRGSRPPAVRQTQFRRLSPSAPSPASDAPGGGRGGAGRGRAQAVLAAAIAGPPSQPRSRPQIRPSPRCLRCARWSPMLCRCRRWLPLAAPVRRRWHR